MPQLSRRETAITTTPEVFFLLTNEIVRFFFFYLNKKQTHNFAHDHYSPLLPNAAADLK